ncbi:haloacid dehalogenase [Lysobacter helvus]|uniref:Haloacid dehalogenase n=2 Tax=Lysobacteraceae TaxID=32033 RepID=A0ABN6FUC1_9GAMM|nr:MULTISPECIES: HAD family hydrolase [Lysobacter]BCT93215.1 haloacid dehalogenase [Lysobacter caseinilyticus]BCT96367.1 haloacid dehalogenase [Lysobacter helvus]
MTSNAGDPLPSWNDGAARRAILDFVAGATRNGGPQFVPPEERIAVFDNDGTLWAEKPMYFQLLFVLDRIRALAPHHPEWRDTEPFKSVLAGNIAGVAASGEHGAMVLLAATHAGMTTEEFSAIVRDWMSAARHPATGKPYNGMTYVPMQELMQHLRANGFKTYIVSGGGQEFMRPWVEAAYGVPPEHVVGSYVDLKFEVRDGTPVLLKVPSIGLVDDHAGKPVGIQRFIGRRPVFAFGNSDGDFEMLQWTTAGEGARFGAILHHTDDKREFAYDRDSKVGKLDKALDAANDNGWVVVDMAQDWKRVFADAATD